jgi:hypothetical protein
MISIDGFEFVAGKERDISCNDNDEYSKKKLYALGIDSMGLCDKYPDYCFRIKENCDEFGETCTATLIVIDSKFDVKFKSWHWIIRTEHIKKYEFVENENGLFTTQKYDFLKKYQFDKIEYLEDPSILCLFIYKK